MSSDVNQSTPCTFKEKYEFELIANKITPSWNGSKNSLNKDLNEETRLVSDKTPSADDIIKLQTLALVVSWVSVIFSMISGVLGIVFSVRCNSESLFAYGLDAILDSLSSIAVVWRFHGPSLLSSERERRACIAIGLAFLVSATSLVGRSIYALVEETHESKNISLYEKFAAVCVSISIFLATAKVVLGCQLSSKALINDSIITYIGAASCLAGVLGLELYIKDSELWYLDPVFGTVLGVLLLVIGIRLLVSSIKK